MMTNSETVKLEKTFRDERSFK